MAGTIALIGAGDPTKGGVVNNGNTAWQPIGSQQPIEQSTETLVQIVTRGTPVFSYASWHIGSNSKTSAAVTLRNRINAVNGACTASVAFGTTGHFEDAVNSNTLADGDKINLQYVNGGGDLGSVSYVGLSARLQPSSGNLAYYSAAVSTGFSAASTTSFWPIGGGHRGTIATTEAAAQEFKLGAPGTLDRAQCHVSGTNGRSTASTLGVRINAAAGNGLVSITASTAGFFEDAVNSDSISAGTKADWGLTTGSGSGTTTIDQTWIRFIGSGAAYDFVNSSDAGSPQSSVTISVDNFYSPFGISNATTTEALAQLKARTSGGLLSRLHFQVRINTQANTITGTFRIGGSNSGQSVSIGSGTTGSFDDTVNTAATSDGDLLCFRHSAPSTTGFVLNQLAVTMTQATGETGTAAQTLGGATQAASGGTEAQGTAAQTLRGPNQAATGFQGDAAAIVQILGHVSQAASGGQGEAGAAAQTLGAISQAASGFIEPGGPIVQTLRGITQEAHGIGAPGAPRITQAARISVLEVSANARSTQAARLAVAEVSANARATQAVRLVAAQIEVEARSTQAARLIIAAAVPCGTTWCQCWRITRKDGQIFRFTSLDEDFSWGSKIFSACGSLNPSASESSTSLGQVGSIELTGIIASSAITAGDLYGGLFDDAFVEVWLVDYAGADTPKRIAAGWTGQLSQEAEGSFKMEVIGPGARLQQQALVQTVAPRCRWKFGDARCGIDREARSLSGEVLFSVDRGNFTAEIDPGTLSSGGLVSGAASSGADENESQWENGTVRFESGSNAGQECEVKTVDFATGQIVLWALPANTPIAGDAFTLLPGCAQDKAACQLYANFDRFGGYPNVPGDDAIAQVPDATAS